MRTTFSAVLLTALLPAACAHHEPPTVCDQWPANRGQPAAETTLFGGVDRSITNYLDTLDPTEPMDHNLHAFEHWLQQQPCLQQVGLPADLTTLAPPGQEISLVHCNGSHRTVNVVFTPDRIYLDYCH